MTKANFFRYYNKLSGSDKTLIFFEYLDNIYIWVCTHIPPRYTAKTRESSKNGGYEKFKMRITADEKARLVNKGAVRVMTITEFENIPYSNKGFKCESYLHTACNLGEYKPNPKRFDMGGDVRIDGIEYQVKFENASITNVNVLHNAQRYAREQRV